jgi:hypothetical protein
MKKLVFVFVLVSLALSASACSSSGPTDIGKIIKSAPVGMEAGKRIS